MGRSPSSDENGVKKGPWTPEEDEKLVQYIQKHGYGSWRALPKLAGLNRCGKSCRLRWTNYLRPDIKRGKFSHDEEQTILHLHSILGNKWSAIATHLPGRTDNEIKNFWNTHVKKKLIQMGFDPMTHQPRTDLFSNLPQLLILANLNAIFDHHSLAEAAELAKLQVLHHLLQSPTSTQNQNYNNPNADMEAFSSLMNSVADLPNNNISENPILLKQSRVVDNMVNPADSLFCVEYDHNINNSSQPLHQDTTLLSDVDPPQDQVPFTSQPSLNNRSGIVLSELDNNSNYFPEEYYSSWSLPSSVSNMSDHETTSINSNHGDASSSTYGNGNASSDWPTYNHLFLHHDSFVHGIS